MVSLTAEQIEQFIAAGFVKLEGAFPRDIGEQCRQEIWKATEYELDQPSTWAQPFVRLESPPCRFERQPTRRCSTGHSINSSERAAGTH